MCGYPYILCYEMAVTNLFNTWLFSGCEEKILGCILDKPEESCQGH